MSATAQNTRNSRNPAPFSSVLKRVWPRHTAKHAAAVAQSSVRTAQAWLADRCSPSIPKLLEMAQRDDNLRAEMVRLLMETADVGTMDQMAGAAPGHQVSTQGSLASGRGVPSVQDCRPVARARRQAVKP